MLLLCPQLLFAHSLRPIHPPDSFPPPCAPLQFGWTPLHIAAEGGYLDVVEALLKYDADVAAKDDVRSPSAPNPILYAISAARRFCCFCGADADARERGGAKAGWGVRGATAAGRTTQAQWWRRICAVDTPALLFASPRTGVVAYDASPRSTACPHRPPHRMARRPLTS